MHCITPIKLKCDGEGTHRLVSCGYCLRCRLKRSKEWAFRLKQEGKRHTDAYFVTLTYSDNNLVYGGDKPTLYKRHLQLYMKKIRKAQPNTNIKYYAVGEYGTKTQRPHYHIIMYSAHIDNIVNKWEHGHTYIGDVTDASIQYVTGYIIKPRLTKLRDDTRAPEFSTMSNGIGDNYLTPQMIRYHKTHLHGYVHDHNQKKPMSRYYKDKIYDDADMEIIKDKYDQLRRQNMDKDNAKTRYNRVTLDAIKFRNLKKSVL